MTDLNDILSAFASGNTLRRKHDRLRELHTRIQNQLYCEANRPHREAIQKFARELLAAIQCERPDARFEMPLDYCSGCLTIKFDAAGRPGDILRREGELTVWLYGDRFHLGGTMNNFPSQKRPRTPRTLWFSARPDTRSTEMRKWPLTLRTTPASIWARASRFFIKSAPLLPPLPIVRELATK
ncbi:MAG TPA: hypothetical protein VK742_01140 [Candidatus Sulfotelmatobacter sp.]|jgi:hypothetical protein|nr:hypothetical protein [Candidatus Sulfotelmatobacter sp.]